MELGSQVGVLGARGGAGGFGECVAESRAALTRLATATLASTLIVAGAHARPGGEVRRTGEASHIRTDLGQQDLGCAAAHARDGIQVGQRFVKRAQALSNFATDPLNRL